MAREFSQDTPQVTFVDRDQEVEALAPYRSYKSFAKRIGDHRLLHLKVTLRRDVSG